MLQHTVKIAALAVLITACASTPQAPPVQDATTQAPIERSQTPDAENAARQERLAIAEETREVTNMLLAQAQTALGDNNQRSAINLLERAVRLAPRDSELWVALGHAHLADGNVNSATQHVRKAIALAGNEPTARRRAWLAMADIREYEGLPAEAASIRRRYNRIGS